jgi:hypothetical protein
MNRADLYGQQGYPGTPAPTSEQVAAQRRGAEDVDAALGNAYPPTTNPKDAMAQADGRLRLDLIPPAALAHEATAMMYGAFEAPRKDGGKGYGPMNWRDVRISARVYVAAAMRHLLDYLDGEDLAPDSKAHHLGHARATLGIVLDAAECGALDDDRPKKGSAARLMQELRRPTEPERPRADLNTVRKQWADFLSGTTECVVPGCSVEATVPRSGPGVRVWCRDHAEKIGVAVP